MFEFKLLEFFLILMTTKNFTHPEKGIKNHKHAVIPQSPALTKVTETWLSAPETF